MDSPGLIGQRHDQEKAASASSLAATYRSLAASTPNSNRVYDVLETEKRVLYDISKLSVPKPLPQWRHAVALQWQLPLAAANSQHSTTSGSISSSSAPTDQTRMHSSAHANTFGGRLIHLQMAREAARAEFDEILSASQRQRRAFTLVEKRSEMSLVGSRADKDRAGDDSLVAFPRCNSSVPSEG